MRRRENWRKEYYLYCRHMKRKKWHREEELNRDQFADNFVCKNFISFDLIRTFAINR